MATQVPAALRDAYLASLIEPQELYVEQLVRRGQPVLMVDDATAVGYAVVTDSAIVEFFVAPPATGMLRPAFESILDHSQARTALCKTFDPAMIVAASSRPATVTTAAHLFRSLVEPRLGPDPELRPRPGSSRDADAVWAIHDGFFDDRDEIERYADHDGLWLYDSPAGELVAVGVAARVVPGYDAVDIGMVVAPGHRGRGIGAHVVADLRNRCLAAGDRPICGCAADNPASRRSLERAGFAADHSLLEFTYDSTSA